MGNHHSRFEKLKKLLVLSSSKRRAISGTTSAIIPDDVILEILHRLPARSLIRFRSVCTSWRSMITDPDFSRAHLGSICTVLSAYDSAAGCWVLTVLDDEGAVCARLSRPGPRHDLFLLSSCNGVLCLVRANHSVELLNAVTGEELLVPGSANACPADWYCLGCHRLTGELRIVHLYYRSDNVAKTGFEVYDVASGSWRQVGSLRVLPRGRGVHDDGVVYFPALDSRQPRSTLLLAALDLDTENVRLMPLPCRELAQKSSWWHWSMMELGGRLALSVLDVRRRTMTAQIEQLDSTKMDVIVLGEDIEKGKMDWSHEFSLVIPKCTERPPGGDA